MNLQILKSHILYNYLYHTFNKHATKISILDKIIFWEKMSIFDLIICNGCLINTKRETFLTLIDNGKWKDLGFVQQGNCQYNIPLYIELKMTVTTWPDPKIILLQSQSIDLLLIFLCLQPICHKRAVIRLHKSKNRQK